MTLPVLPQDVFDEIFSQLPNKTSTLKSYSLVCRSFRRNAQKMLFYFIDVVLTNDSDDGDNIDNDPLNLVLIVKHAPHLIEYIQSLRILSIDLPLDFNASKYTDLADALGAFSRKGEFPINLDSLSLEGLSWDYMPPRLQDALVLLMSVHSLEDITLDHVINWPANLVQNLSPLLKDLSLTYTTFSSLPTTRNELPKLESLMIVRLQYLQKGGIGLDQFLSDGIQRIVDITQLKSFNGDTRNLNSMPLIEQFLRPTSNSLECLKLRFDVDDSDSISIDLNQFPRLTDIIMTIFYPSRVVGTFPLISPAIITTIKNISHRNTIQNLSFCLFLGCRIRMVDFESAMNDMWQELDTICFIPQLASSKSFRGITFIIGSTAIALDRDAFSDLVQNKLPETKKANKLHIDLADW